MKREFPHRVLPGKLVPISAVAIWDGPQSLYAVMRLKGTGDISLVHPNDAAGRPKPGSTRDCLRIHRPDKTCVAHPGDLIVTDWEGRLSVVHGYGWAAAHGARFTWEDS